MLIHTVLSWLILYYMPHNCSRLNFLYSACINRMSFKGTNTSPSLSASVDHSRHSKLLYRFPWVCTLPLLTTFGDRSLDCTDPWFEHIIANMFYTIIKKKKKKRYYWWKWKLHVLFPQEKGKGLVLFHDARDCKLLPCCTKPRTKIRPVKWKPSHVRIACPCLSFSFWMFISDTECACATCPAIPYDLNHLMGTHWWLEYSFLQKNRVHDSVSNT